jgi:hypothetical protein
VQALRLHPETKAIPLLKLLLVLPHGPREGAQAAEDGTLEPWINRRRVEAIFRDEDEIQIPVVQRFFDDNLS